MGDELKLTLFGKPQITVEGAPMKGLTYKKSQALLYYLAVSGRPHSREVLSGLLWGETSEVSARANLRKVVSDLRGSVAAQMVVTRDTVGFNCDHPYSLDVEQFESRMRCLGPTALGHHTLGEADVKLLCEAVELYRGDFLEGFHIYDAAEFYNWVLGQRERLRHLALSALHLLAAHYTAQGAYAAGIDCVTRLLNLEPWQEEAHQGLMTLLALSGQRSAALRQYEAFRRIMRDELGAEPSEHTKKLCEQIRSGQLGPDGESEAGLGTGKPGTARERNAAVPVSTSIPPAPRLPIQLTSFVGREEELKLIGERLGQPDHRLVTVTGPSGIGKSRLVVQAARQQSHAFPDGVYFVPLVEAESVDHLLSAVANVLEVGLHENGLPEAQLLVDYLRPKKLLLVLDDYQHHSLGAGLVLDILRNAPTVGILVTSRQRLNLQAESVLRLAGLPFPQVAQDPKALEYAAVQLFVQRAGQAQMGFALSPEDTADVVRICQLVEGMPLAIELAAAQAGTRPVREIARSMERDLDFLSTSFSDLAPRHRSLRATFDHTYLQLTPTEQDSLRRLAVFPKGFSPEAARQVCGTGTEMLAALVGNSLVFEQGWGSYTMPSVIRHYAAEKLDQDPGLLTDVQARQALYEATHCGQGKSLI